DLGDLDAQVPNLTVYAARGSSSTITAYIRGVGQSDPLWGVDPGVGLYFDDVYIARPQGALLDVYDVQRIEVLRGPQGTLYGKNTIGGAIKYVSRELGDQLAGSVSLTAGSYNTQDVRASVGGAIIPEKLRARVAIASLKHDGFGENLFLHRDVSDKDTVAGRASFEWIASESLHVGLSYDRTRDRGEPKAITRLAANPFCLLTAFGGTGTPCPAEKPFETHSGLRPINSTDSEGYSLNLNWGKGGAWSIRSVTAHRESDSENTIDFDTTPGRIVDVFATYNDKQDSQELQFLYDGKQALSGVFGVYWFDGKAGGLVKNIFINGVGVIPNFGTTDGTMKTKSFAVFGDGTYKISDRLGFDFGVRATQEKKSVHAFNAAYTNDTFSTVHTVLAAFDKSKTFSSVAPRLGLDYRFSDDVMGYVSASRGFKSGGFNVRANTLAFPRSSEPFKDEVLDVLEVGVKSVLLDHQLVLNTAAFYGDYKDIQVSVFTTTPTGGFFGQVLNAGSATMKGAEVEFDALSVGPDWLGFAGQVSYLDADADPLDANHNGLLDTQVITNAPEFTGSLRSNLRFQAFGGALTASVGYAYRDDSTLTNEGEQVIGGRIVSVNPISQKAYGLWDAYVSWLAPSAHWRVGLTGKNLSDEEYLTNGYNIPSLGILQGAYGNPRMVTATLEFSFF
ncbi:MAG TPA: TonB-dependent receptor, partial [Thermoanaerobaculia bacterium]|nr:TonB-dependent receptor [Thermoanaerobaculia bacterium]